MRKALVVSKKNTNNPKGRKPKFSTRSVNRCIECGRPRGYVRKFKLCRICLREKIRDGLVPGVKSASQ
jgi:small subunit ribosomal protein S14